MTEQEAAEEMERSFQSIHDWLHRMHTSGISVEPNKILRLHQVLATEEPLYSIKYGLKGIVDATTILEMHEKDTGETSKNERPRTHHMKMNRKDNPLPPCATTSSSMHDSYHVMPLELKTGKKPAMNPFEHYGQVLLYTLLLAERYHGIIRITLYFFSTST